MIVCICRGVSDRRVRLEIENGASSIAALQACGIGDQCGSCHSMLKVMLAQAVAEDAVAAAAEPVCPCASVSVEDLVSVV